MCTLPGFQWLDSLAVEQSGRICVGTLWNGGMTVFEPGGEYEFIAVSRSGDDEHLLRWAGHARRVGDVLQHGAPVQVPLAAAGIAAAVQRLTARSSAAARCE